MKIKYFQGIDGQLVLRHLLKIDTSSPQVRRRLRKQAERAARVNRFRSLIRGREALPVLAE